MPLVTAAQAAEILGISRPAVYALASAGDLTRQTPKWARGQAYDLDEIEARSLAQLGRHDTGHHYWVTRAEAAEILGVTVSRIAQMIHADQLPHVTAPNGRRYLRRPQLEVIANARAVRAVVSRAD